MISGTDSYMYLVHRGGPCFVLSQYGQLKLHLVRQPELLFLFQQSLPPVRNQSKRKKKKKKESSTFSNNACKPKDKTRISSYDYRSWDKFDVVSMWVTCSMRFLCQLADVIPTCKILCMQIGRCLCNIRLWFSMAISVTKLTVIVFQESKSSRPRWPAWQIQDLLKGDLEIIWWRWTSF